ncbi:UDP-N-acetylenolpyruvoylglucosamine reductase [Bacteroidales bacterium Barb6XT]|nr:UDP-N-acetylenolpyruvoylglucosamine reductase [Bacteroidales bacterium Barb6XT]
MRIEENYPLERHNTFRLPVKTRWFMEYGNEEELEKILRDEYFQECGSLHIGGGSNLLFLNDVNGIVLHSQIKGMAVTEETEDYVLFRVGAAETWDDVVACAVANGWSGIENLSLIPGEAGAAAVQNIGAYGTEIRDVLVNAEAYNRLTFEKRLFTNAECNYAYRYSYFKNEHNDPHILTHITLRLSKRPTASPATVRETVISRRRDKLPDPAVLGNAGSFFMNPVISPVQFEKLKEKHPAMLSYPAAEGKVKLSAAWLIEQCGFKGKRYGEVGIYEKHALILVNFGGATGNEIALLAESIRMEVENRFGIGLKPEVRYA